MLMRPQYWTIASSTLTLSLHLLMRCKNSRQLAELDDCFDSALLSTASVFHLTGVNTSTIMSTVNLSM
uniref:Uncharacterized protein n=1 Tax=Timema poppense TaxID=170557 RepID=A0A7R9H265_TIMPO|nr:unnamed protein product [Timema poppensis]